MDQDLIDLLAAWRGDEIAPERQQQLLERLRRDDAFQESFIDEIQMFGMIKVVQSTEPRWLRLQDELGWAGQGTGSESESESAIEDALMEQIRGIPLGPKRGLWWWGMAVLALAAAVVVAALATQSRPQPRSKPAAATAATAATATAAAAAATAGATAPGAGAVAGARGGQPGGGLALLVKLEAARWEPAEQAGRVPEPGSILGPGRIKLRSGRAGLSFFSGVTLTLEGPADVELIAIDRVFCRQGRLRARVPEGAEGFVVASPGSAVVDMGTEFALNVEADGTSRVMVFEGAAEAALLDASGSPTRTQVVEQSKAFELDPRTGRIAESPARPERFVAAVDSATARLDLDPGYPSAIMSAQPRGYWRFETIADGVVPNEVAGSPPLRVHGPITVAAAGSAGGATNGCAVFAPGEPAQNLATEERWGLPADPGHALELWFLSEGISHASLAGLFPPKDYLGPGKHGRHIHTFLLELTAWDRQSLFKPASIRFLHRWPLDTRIGSNILSEEIYVPGRWHHLVAQKNGPRIELYFNGALVRTLALQPDHPTVSGRLVVGRRNPDPLELVDTRSFAGRLDELAFYDHPLSAEEVRHHYQMATARAGPE